MNKIFSIISVLFCLFFCIGCGLPYANKIKLSKSDQEWVPYQIGDSIFFRCDKLIDTLIITETKINNPRNTFLFDTEGVDWFEGNHHYYGNASCKYILFHNGKRFDGILFVLKKTDSKRPATIGISFAGIYSKNKPIDKAFLYTEKRNECLLFNTSDLEKGKHQESLDIRQIIWSKKHGLLQYFITQDSTYTYLKKQNTKKVEK